MIALLLAALDDPSLEADFMIIFDKYEKRILKYAYCCLNDFDSAQIVTQDTFFAFARRMHDIDYSIDTAVSAYLYKVAKNKCYKMAEMGKKKPQIIFLGDEDQFIEDFDNKNAIEETAISNETIQKMQAFLNELPEIYRDVLSLHYISGLSARDIAETIEIPVNTAKTHLRRAKIRIKEFWKKEEDNAK